MTVPECHLVRDLLVPYLAGEASPETVTFMNGHFSRCAECRAALTAMTGETPPAAAPAPPPPSAEPGRRLVGRVRRQVILLMAVVVTSLALAIGGVVWGVSAFQRWANDPTKHPVPSYSTPPAAAAQVDLSPLGLTPVDVSAVPDGAIARFQTADGETVTLAFYLHASPYRASEAYEGWYRSFSVKTMSVQSHSGSVGSARFRSGGHYYQGWHDDRWFITVDVPDSVPQAADLRAGIFQQLGTAWVR
jgi:hypothetical protein